MSTVHYNVFVWPNNDPFYAYAQSLEKFGYVRGVGEYSFDSPRGNLTGEPWFTDGVRVVLIISGEQTDISEIEFLELGALP